MKYILLLISCATIFLSSCNDEKDDCCAETSEAKLIIKLKFDPTQERLNNLGQPATIPLGNAAQSPLMKKMSLNYIEFAPSANTLLGDGTIVYTGNETNDGGARAINFQEAVFAGNNETFFSTPLSDIAPGTYNWARVSLAYQEGDIQVLSNGIDFTGTLASFVGYNTYISSFDLNNQTIDVDSNKLQGFWAFETQGFLFQGQAPEGATTVPNPLFNTSPIPAGSCVVTGDFGNGFEITGDEEQDIEITLSFSVNQSFEWTEINPDGKYEPAIGELVVDMGVRGLKLEVSN